MEVTSNSTSFDYMKSTKFDFSFPPGARIVDMVPEDMKAYIHPHWNAFPPVNPMWHYILGIGFIFLGITAFLGNGAVLYLFTVTKDLKTPTNNLVVNLALSDFLMMLTRCPIFVYNSFNGGVWHQGPLMCEIYGSVGGVFGITSISTMTAIALDRYNVIVRGMNGPRLTNGKSAVIILLCWGYGMFWGLSPFFVGNRYIPEGILNSCSFDYLTRDEKTITFSLVFFVGAYCIPLTTIVFSYTYIVRTIFEHEKTLREQAAKMNVASLRSNADVNAQSAEFRIARIALVNITLWVCMWTPYACIVLQGAFGDQSTITPLITILPALLAKTSSVFNPVVFAISHPKFRLALQKSIPWFCIHEPEEPKGNGSVASGATIESNNTA